MKYLFEFNVCNLFMKIEMLYSIETTQLNLNNGIPRLTTEIGT